jgi:hypothetical protein
LRKILPFFGNMFLHCPSRFHETGR